MERSVLYNGKLIFYEYLRKKVKNINIHVRGDGRVWVSAAYYVPLKEVDRAVLRRAQWILDAQERVGKKEPNGKSVFKVQNGAVFSWLGKPRILQIASAAKPFLQISEDTAVLFVPEPENRKKLEKIFAEQYKALALEILKGTVQTVYEQFFSHLFSMPEVTVRRMKTRWGSCAPAKAKISMNLCLMQVPPQYARYVAAHELCHMIHANHSSRFYTLLAKLEPNYLLLRKELNHSKVDFENF